MKCDIYHQENAQPKTSRTESDGVRQFQFQTPKIFPQYILVWNDKCASMAKIKK